MILWPVEFGALTQLWAATSPEGLNMSGKFLWPWAREGCMPWTATSLELQAKIWEWCETQIQNL
jgi:retinol dehydrogenase-12